MVNERVPALVEGGVVRVYEDSAPYVLYALTVRGNNEDVSSSSILLGGQIVIAPQHEPVELRVWVPQSGISDTSPDSRVGWYLLVGLVDSDDVNNTSSADWVAVTVSPYYSNELARRFPSNSIYPSSGYPQRVCSSLSPYEGLFPRRPRLPNEVWVVRFVADRLSTTGTAVNKETFANVEVLCIDTTQTGQTGNTQE